MLDEFLKLEVRPPPRLRGLPRQLVEAHPAYLADEVLAVAYHVVGPEAVARAALGVGVVLVPARRHVAAAVVVPAVGLGEGLRLAAADAPEVSAGTVPEPDVERKLPVEPGLEVGLLLHLDARPLEQRRGGVFLLWFAFEVVHGVLVYGYEKARFLGESGGVKKSGAVGHRLVWLYGNMLILAFCRLISI